MGMKGDTENMKPVWQIFLFLTVLVSCLTGCGRRQAMEIEEETFPAVSSFEEESQEETEVSRGTLFVDVRGAVAKPGVYELPEKSRVFEAVEAAGGLLPEALERLVNQAAELTDGQQVYIPFEGEETEGGQAPLQETDDRVNINTAGPEELKTLPGIGEARAADIIAYREAKGGFSSIEEIMQVSGIKDAMFQKIRDKIKV